jgi:hypothetical protein
LKHTIENTPNLKSLKLIYTNNSKAVFDFKLPKLNYLEKMDNNLNYEVGRLKDVKCDVSTCKKLKSISITKNKYYIPFENPELIQDLYKDWKCLYFRYKLIFIKK